MKKTTMAVLLVFAGLLAAVLWMERTPSGGESSSMTIPGYLEDPAKAVKTTTDIADPGFESIILERAGERVVLEKKGADWAMTAPKQAKVEQFKVKQMLLPLQTPSESLFSKVLDERDLGLYGLSAEEATAVTITKGGAEWASFVVGSSEKSESGDEDEVDTWAMRKGGKEVFRIGGKNLHHAFSVGVNDLRDKALFPFEKNDLRKVTLRDPGNAEHPEIVMVNTHPAQAKDAGVPPEPGASDVGTWVFEKPADRTLGNPSGLLGSIASLRVAEFVAKDKGVDTGLGDTDAPYVIEMQIADGSQVTLRVGKDDGTNTWAEVVGTGELVKIPKFTATNLKKTVGDLREKKALGVAQVDVMGVAFPDTGVEVERRGDGFAFVSPTGIELGKDDMDALLRDIETFAVADFVASPPPAEETGLDPEKARKVTIRTRDGAVELLFGAEKDSKVWVQRAGDTEAWRVSSFTAKRFAKTPEDLRDKQVVRFTREDLTRIALTRGEETTTLERSGGDAHDHAEGEQHDHAAEATGEWVLAGDTTAALDRTQVSALVTTLVNLKARAFEPTKALADVGLGPDKAFSLVATLKDGSTVELLLSSEQREGETYAVVSGGAGWRGQVFTVNQYQATNLMKMAGDLKKG